MKKKLLKKKKPWAIKKKIRYFTEMFIKMVTVLKFWCLKWLSFYICKRHSPGHLNSPLMSEPVGQWAWPLAALSPPFPPSLTHCRAIRGVVPRRGQGNRGGGGGGVFSLIIDGTRGRSKLLKDIIIWPACWILIICQITLLGYLGRRLYYLPTTVLSWTSIQKDTCSPVFIAALFTIVKTCCCSCPALWPHHGL